MNSNKTYSKKEISKILNRASEIQIRREIHRDRDGLSKEELLELADEAGIDADVMLEAIYTMDDPNFKNTFSWWAGTSKVQIVKTVEGEVNDENWDDLIKQMRKVTGGIGADSKSGKSYEWEQQTKDIGYRHISLTPKEGKTSIQYVLNWPGIKFITNFFGFLIPFMITAISFDGSDTSMFIAALTSTIAGVTGVFGVRIFQKLYFEKQKKQLSNIIDAISARLHISSFAKTSSSIEIEDQGLYQKEEHPSSSRSKQRNT